MSSVTKPVAASTSPVTSSRPGAGSARQVSSQYGAVSELFAQSGVRGEDESRGFEDFNQGKGDRNPAHDQPPTLKLHGTSRTFAMLFEDVRDEYGSGGSDDGYFGEDAAVGGGRPAFQAYMAKATNTYDLSTRVVSGDTKNRGGSLNIAM